MSKNGLSLIVIALFFLLISSYTLYASEGGIENVLEKGIAEYKAENYEEAIEIFKKIKEEQPDSSIAYFYLGLTYKQVGNYKEAADLFREAINLVPSINDAYPELIEMLYNLNNLKDAGVWIAKAEEKNIKPASIAFLKGLVFLKEGDNKGAVDAFTRAKELDKTLTQASDFQIATVYLKERQFSKAKETLRAVVEIAPASSLADFAKEYEKSIARILETYSAWKFTVGVSYQYDDNVVLKPSTAISGVEITGEKDSSILTSFRIIYAPFLEGQRFINAEYNYSGNTHFETKSQNLSAHTISLIPGYNFQRGAITLPLAYSHVWLKDEEYMGVLMVKPTLNMMLLPGHIGQFSIGYTKKEMLTSPLTPDEDRDSNMYLVTAGYIHPVYEGNGIVSLIYELSNDLTDGINWENIGNKINAAAIIPLKNRMFSLIMSGEIFLQDYSNTNTAFGEKRKDETYTASTGIKWEIRKDLSFNLEYSHTRVDSNLPIYDYKRNVYNGGIEYRF